MSKLLELKIRKYEKNIHDHNLANKRFCDELVFLIKRCEERYKTVLKAPNDSPEWRAIVIKRTEQPVLSFRSRKMGDIPAHEAAEIRHELVDLYNRGYPTATIAHILGIRFSTAASTISSYQRQANSDNARKANS